MKEKSILFLIILFMMSCEEYGSGIEEQYTLENTEEVLIVDTLPSSVIAAEEIVPKNLVVGFEELNLFFHDWPENYTLNYSGHPLNDNFSVPTSLEIRYDFNRVCKIIFKSWSQEVTQRIKESTYMVGKFPAHRTILPNGNLDYLFEIPENVGWVVHLTEIAPSFEDKLISRFSPTFNEDTDSLISLVPNPFPLQIPKDMQKIGVSFRTEAYHDDFFPRTKIEMRLTNFSNLMTNSIVIADVVGSVDNLTDGKQTFNEGEELKLKNFYAGLAKEWIFVHEGNELVLYEKTESEPSMEMENDMNVESKKILVLPIPEAFEFNFVGYFPMSE